VREVDVAVVRHAVGSGRLHVEARQVLVEHFALFSLLWLWRQ
jgi:hypothetical protein